MTLKNTLEWFINVGFGIYSYSFRILMIFVYLNFIQCFDSGMKAYRLL